MNLLSRIFRRGLSCDQVAEVLQQYLDEELEASQVPKVLKHLETCKDCGLEAEVYTRIKTSLVAHQEAPRRRVDGPHPRPRTGISNLRPPRRRLDLASASVFGEEQAFRDSKDIQLRQRFRRGTSRKGVLPQDRRPFRSRRVSACRPDEPFAPRRR